VRRQHTATHIHTTHRSAHLRCLKIAFMSFVSLFVSHSNLSLHVLCDVCLLLLLLCVFCVCLVTLQTTLVRSFIIFQVGIIALGFSVVIFISWGLIISFPELR